MTDQLKLTPESIVETVCDRYQASTHDVLGPTRQAALIQPRFIAMFMLRRILGFSFPKIGRLFGRDHSSVVHAVKQAQKWPKELDALLAEFGNPPVPQPAEKQLQQKEASVRETRPILLCSVDGCQRKHAARGYCFRHWNAVYRGGKSPDELIATELPGRDNPRGSNDLTEHEFVLMKEFRIAGRSVRECAVELDKTLGAIADAYRFRTYFEYRERKVFDVEDWDKTVSERGRRKSSKTTV